jgi:hypothetical protein
MCSDMNTLAEPNSLQLLKTPLTKHMETKTKDDSWTMNLNLHLLSLQSLHVRWSEKHSTNKSLELHTCTINYVPQQLLVVLHHSLLT